MPPRHEYPIPIENDPKDLDSSKEDSDDGLDAFNRKKRDEKRDSDFYVQLNKDSPGRIGLDGEHVEDPDADPLD